MYSFNPIAIRAQELIIAKFGPVYYQSVRDKLNDCLMQRHLKRQASTRPYTNRSRMCSSSLPVPMQQTITAPPL